MAPQTAAGQSILQFETALLENEKAKGTVKKYVYEVKSLEKFLKGNVLTKALLLNYREALQKKYKAATVNGKLSAINSYLMHTGQQSCKIRLLKVQRQAFVEESRELSEAEYKRLLAAAQTRNNQRLYHLMMTLCGTGIRVGELKYITVETAKLGRAEICLKGKTRTILLPKELRSRLMRYARHNNIGSGCIFRTKRGCPLDRSNICHDMKKLCRAANVNPHKVFPHNLRHLFARTFYAIKKNLANLADILGHSSVETTRIYVAVSAREHERVFQKMRLVI